jgi:hypothetical protein
MTTGISGKKMEHLEKINKFAMNSKNDRDLYRGKN